MQNHKTNVFFSTQGYTTYRSNGVEVISTGLQWFPSGNLSGKSLDLIDLSLFLCGSAKWEQTQSIKTWLVSSGHYHNHCSRLQHKAIIWQIVQGATCHLSNNKTLGIFMNVYNGL